MTVRKSWLRFTCEKALGVSDDINKTIIENNRVNKEPIYDSQKVMAAFHMRKSLGCVTKNNN